MVLCATAPKIGNDELWNGRIAAVEKGGIKSLADGVIERWFSKEFSQNHPATYAGYTASSAAIRDADFTQECANIKIPTLCVVGDQDGATPPSVVVELAKLIPDSCFEVNKDAGHLPCIEQPEILADMIKAFFDDAGLWPGKGSWRVVYRTSYRRDNRCARSTLKF